MPELPEVRDVASNAFDWVMGVILVYGCLFGIGKLVFAQWLWGFVLLGVAADGVDVLVVAGPARLGERGGGDDCGDGDGEQDGKLAAGWHEAGF